MVGASPSFSNVHLLRAILLLFNKPLGRKLLVKQLGVGEGSVRTILKRLWALGWVESARGGQKLSESGMKKIEVLNQSLQVIDDFSSTDIAAKNLPQVLVLVKSPTHDVSSTLNLRDMAIRIGAQGAVIVVSKGEKLVFPSVDAGLDVFGDLYQKLNGFSLGEGDVAVICWGNKASLAQDGALTIALHLLFPADGGEAFLESAK